MNCNDIFCFRSLTPALTIYLTHPSSVDGSKGSVFRALYLNSLTCGELSMRLAAQVGLLPSQIADIFTEGPGGIKVLITNEVVQHMKNEGLFAVDLCQGMMGPFHIMKKNSICCILYMLTTPYTFLFQSPTRNASVCCWSQPQSKVAFHDYVDFTKELWWLFLSSCATAHFWLEFHLK